MALAVRNMQIASRFDALMHEVGVLQPIQEALRTRGYTTMATFSYAVDNREALEDLILDILVRAENVGAVYGIDWANCAISTGSNFADALG